MNICLLAVALAVLAWQPVGGTSVPKPLPTAQCVSHTELDRLGRSYAGNRSTTVSGRTCQSWSSQTPHKHINTLPNDGNKCRNPDHTEDLGPWCYTTDPNVRWEPCFQACKEPPTCFKTQNDLKHFGMVYKGDKNTTVSGRECQKWSSQTPHWKNQRNSSPGDHNKCRNPDETDVGPWCYTVDPKVRWEPCFEICKEPANCFKTKEELARFGKNYTGIRSKTVSGRTCQKWSSQSPHAKNARNSAPGDHNFCRNPDDTNDGPWCYTMDHKVRWEPCFAICGATANVTTGNQTVAATTPTHANSLYKCEAEEAFLHHACEAGHTCSQALNTSTCSCAAGKKYCGFEMRLLNQRGQWDEHSIYTCGAGTRVEACNGKCVASKGTGEAKCVAEISNACAVGSHYCGSQLIALGSPDRWPEHTLYECTLGFASQLFMGIVDRCDSGCITRPTPHCNTRPDPHIPSLTTTTPAATLTTTSKPFVPYECEVLDPDSCKGRPADVCLFVNRTYKCVCPSRYEPIRVPDTDKKCVVTNECADVRKHNCSVNAECIDQLVGYTCRCRAGYADKSPNRHLPGRVCNPDINECSQSWKVDCHVNASCINTRDYFTCRCNPGFEDLSVFFNMRPGRYCVPKRPNPCLNASLHDCSPNATCVQTPTGSGYTCRCNLTYVDVSPHVATLPGRVCLPIRLAPLDHGARCDPRKGNADCPKPMVCLEGFSGSAICQCPSNQAQLEGGICLKFDPCLGQNVDCDLLDGECVPTLSGFTCQCRPGTKDISPNPNEPGRLCVRPINECANETLNDCSPFARCIDRDLGYECQCLDEYSDISVVSRRLVGRVCVPATNPCASVETHSCDAHADCIPTLGGYTCQCEVGYADVSASVGLPIGRLCTLNTACPGQVTDLVFILDGSSSITEPIFKRDVLPFVREVTKVFEVGRDATRVGIVQYAGPTRERPEYIRVEFDLNKYTNAAELEKAIERIPYLKGGTRTGAAIDFTARNIFTERAGARPFGSSVHSIAVVITDGKSYDDVIHPARNARRKGISLYAVGVTPAVRRSELAQIAGDTSRYTIVETFTELDAELRAKIQKEICPEVHPPPARCTSDRDCSRARNEICLNGTCGCPNVFCRHPTTGQCGPVITCDPTATWRMRDGTWSHITCPSPLVCKRTPYGTHRCACRDDFSCEASTGSCLPPNPPRCIPPQVLNPSLTPSRCENCDPFCDSRWNEECVKNKTSGEFKCACKPRFKRDPKSKLCVSDKCKSSDCDRNAECYNTFDSYFCTCPYGYLDVSPDPTRPGRRCRKVENPCTNRTRNNCSIDATCVPKGSGNYNCVCKNGFFDFFQHSGLECIPAINECLYPSAHNCSPNANCIDLKIGYSCICKPGFIDTNISLPGRNCVPAPTQAPVTTTTPTPPPRPTLCEAGGLYCGHQLIALKYRNIGPNNLYECDANNNAILYKVCKQNTYCDSNGTSPFCPCENTIRYCGHELQAHNTPTTVPIEPNAIYVCRAPIEKEEDCSGACIPGEEETDTVAECHENINTTCQIGKPYCGSHIKFHGITFWSPRFHAVYNCTNGIMSITGMKFIEQCRNGCDPVTGRCLPGPNPEKPEGLTTTTPVSTSTTTTRFSTTTPTPPPRECEVLDPQSCNTNLSEICAFVNGTYKCVCPPRFNRLPDGRCRIKECDNPRFITCSINAECIDLQPNGYTCKCREGYLDASPNITKFPGRLCKPDVASCDSRLPFSTPCHRDAECIKVGNWSTCRCKAGFLDVSANFNLLPGRRCEPKRENPCKNNTLNDCSPNAACQSAPDNTSYTCECKRGFVDVSPNVVLRPGRTCVPIIPGQTNVSCDSHRDCRPPKVCSEGKCECPANSLELIDGSCLPFNPCLDLNVDCDLANGSCVMTATGFTCQCKPGFKDISPNPREPGRKCIKPINECANVTLNDCSPYARCIDKDNGHDCQCWIGYADISAQLNLRPGRRCVNNTNPCLEANSCDRDAKCIPTIGSYICQCEDGYADVSSSLGLPMGRLCVLNSRCPTQPTDLIFVIDGSTSVEQEEFTKYILPFVRLFTKIFEISPVDTRVGVIQYASRIRAEFHLNAHSNRSSLENAISKIQRMGGGTRTGAAIEFMVKHAFTTQNGSRPLVSAAHKIGIIITDSQSYDEVIGAAKDARRRGIQLFAIGVGDDIDLIELEQIAGDRSKYALVPSFRQLDLRLRARIQERICPEITEVPGPCTSNADCKRHNNEICVNGTCACPKTFCLNPTSGQCGPVETCNPLVNATCPSPLVCKRTPYGSHRCSCPKDFTCELGTGSCVPPKPPKCKPPQILNPSLAKPACENCDPFCDNRLNEVCVKQGSYFRCVCKVGFIRTVWSRICISDICNTSNPCPANSECDNTFAGVVCTCLPGYRPIYAADVPLDPLYMRCIKVVDNPCNKTNNCSKDATCIPSRAGNYKCLCKDGFIDLTPPPNTGFVCLKKVNECASLTTNNCSSNANCVDLTVGYTCICKPGFTDMNIKIPGRNCAIVTTTPATTTTTSAGRPNLCQAGHMYCGYQLTALHYTNADAHTLYECDQDHDGVFYHKCLDYCDSNGTEPHCPCRQKEKYCGHELQALHLTMTIAIEPNSLYICGKPVKKFEDCSGACKPSDRVKDRPAECTNVVNTSCEVGKTYCGMQIKWQGVTFWTPRLHSVYKCKVGILSRQGMEFVKHCQTECDPATGNCKPGPPITKPQVSTTTPVITTTTTEKPVSHECDVMDPNSCNRGFHEVCVLVNRRYKCDCPPGYTRLRDRRCLVIDECRYPDKNNCSENANCIDRLIGYDCECRPRFSDRSPNREKLPGRICLPEINECIIRDPVGTGECDPNSICVDTAVSFTCKCKPGFHDVSRYFNLLPGRFCVEHVDDPCNSTEHDCSPFATCTPVRPLGLGLGYTCRCNLGYVDVSPHVNVFPGRACLEITPNPHPPHKKCNVTRDCQSPKICVEDIYEDKFCECPPGWVELESEDCLAFNPCQWPDVDCDLIDGECIPTRTGFTCQCKPGYKDISPEPSQPGRFCVWPHNECANRTLNTCSPFAECIDKDIGFECHCLPGYADISVASNLPVGRVCINATNPCSSNDTNTCHEHAKCIPTLDGYTCQCEEGYADVSSSVGLRIGRLCTLNTRCPELQLDLVFVIDGSSSVKEPIFKRDVLPFVREFSRLFDIGLNRTRFAAIQYSNVPRIEFPLNKYSDQQALERAIMNIKYIKGGTRTGAAIDFMTRNAFSSQKGARGISDKVRRVGVVITDGQSFDGVIGPAGDARRHGISLYAVGVTNAVNEVELEQIAGSKSKYTVVNTFEKLDLKLRAKIQLEICPETDPRPGPCVVNSECKLSRSEICINGTCGCPPGFCRNPTNGQCGPDLTCDPLVNMTCPSPLTCKRTPYGHFRCACVGEGFKCDARGDCLPPTPARCVPPQVLNPSTRPPKCENCDPFCDERINEVCAKNVTSREFKCVCKLGFKRDEESELCVSDQCRDGKSPLCDRNAECLDTIIGFFCFCPAGYRDESPIPSLPGRVCRKIENACETGNNTCSKNAKCIAAAGGAYSCVCKEGFLDMSPSSPGSICIKPANECASPSTHNCSQNANCTDLKFGYTCACKEGYLDLNIKFPGRNCTLPPTTTTTPVTTTTRPGPRLCESGELYCGFQLTEIGYIGADPNTLYECDDHHHALFYQRCRNGTECIANSTSSTQPFCDCERDKKYCGHELQLLNVPLSVGIDLHSLYVCSVPIQKLADCPIACTPSSRKNKTEAKCAETPKYECRVGQKFCGLAIIWAGSDSTSTVTPHAIYNCSKGILDVNQMQFVQLCRSGCDPWLNECYPEPPLPTPDPTLTTTPRANFSTTTPRPPQPPTPTPTPEKPTDGCDQFPGWCKSRGKLEICRLVRSRYQCECPDNVTRNATGHCSVINECLNPLWNNCSINANCIDQPVGYTCQCKPGYVDISPNKLTHPGRICRLDPIDCERSNITCGANAECKKQGNFARCVCKEGFLDKSEFLFLFPGQVCVKPPPDPCNSSALNDCHANATCRSDKWGFYTCQCKATFIDISPIPTLLGRNCYQIPIEPPITIQPCDPRKGGEDCPRPKICPEGNGTHANCRCPPSMLELSGGTCIPIDVCTLPFVDCDMANGTCVATPTGFSCQCKPGFKDVSRNPREPGRKCVKPTNECANSTLNDCSPFATCIDTDVGFECKCWEGYSDVSVYFRKPRGRVCVNNTNPCSGNVTCDRNAKCIPTVDGYTCQCETGFFDVSSSVGLPVGRICTVHTLCPRQDTDLIFLVDGSTSIPAVTFKRQVLPFVREMTKFFRISPQRTHVGFIQFSNKVQFEFPLDYYQAPESLEAAIMNVTQITGGTRTGQAIDFVVKHGFSIRSGARAINSKARRIAIVLTDGRSFDSVIAPARNARRKAISIYAVGVTDDVRLSELEQIAGDRTKYSHVRTFEELDAKLRAKIQSEICPNPIPVPPNCTVNGNCSSARNEICVNGKCVCPHGFCRNPKTGQCGGIGACDPRVNITCPAPSVCRSTPWGTFRCACPDTFTCELGTGSCLPPKPPTCVPPQVLNPSLPKPVCENCNPFCDDRLNEACIKVGGEFRCGCKPGFLLDPWARLCMDDKCNGTKNPCDPKATCQSTFLHGVICTCPPGFNDHSPNPIFEPGRVCREIPPNPCNTNNCSADATCIPIGSFYACVCKPGFIDLAPSGIVSGRECRKLVNECATATTNDCHANAICKDLQIGYTCICKPGYIDQNATRPGRQCALPPTTTPRPTTPPPPPLCISGRLYCGHQLVALKYTNIKPNAIYECNGGEAHFFKECLEKFPCALANGRPFCPCEPSVKYCGHELQMFNHPSVIPIDDHDVYLCDRPLRRLESCSGKCAPGNEEEDLPARCVTSTGAVTCVPGNKYCGIEIIWQRPATGWSPDPQALFECRNGFSIDGMRFIQECQTGCVHDTVAHCVAGPAPGLPPGAVRSTTPATGTTTLVTTTMRLPPIGSSEPAIERGRTKGTARGPDQPGTTTIAGPGTTTRPGAPGPPGPPGPAAASAPAAPPPVQPSFITSNKMLKVLIFMIYMCAQVQLSRGRPETNSEAFFNAPKTALAVAPVALETLPEIVADAPAALILVQSPDTGVKVAQATATGLHDNIAG